MSHAAKPGRVGMALLANELRLLARRPENVLVSVVVPAVVLAFFSTVPGAPGPAVASRVQVVLPATLALAVIAASFVNLAIATAYERSYGVLKRLGGAPITRQAVVAAKIASVLLVSALTGGVLVALASMALDWRASGAGVQPATLLAALVLGTTAFAALGLALAGSLRAEAVLALANGLFVGVVLFGGIVVPVSELPDGLGAVARALPASALVDAFRAGLGDTSIDATWPLVVLGGWASVAGVVASRSFRWE